MRRTWLWRSWGPLVRPRRISSSRGRSRFCSTTFSAVSRFRRPSTDGSRRSSDRGPQGSWPLRSPPYWRLALLALSIAPFLFVIVYRFTHRMKAASRDARRQEGVVASVAQEVLTSMRAVQAFTREDYEQARFERENEQRVWAGIRARTLAAQLDPLVEVLVAIGSVLVLWYGTQQVLNGTLTPGSLLVFIAYLGGLYKPMRKLSKEADVLSRAAVGLERIVGILETGQTVKDLPGAKVAPTFRGRIQFENVFFSYR